MSLPLFALLGVLSALLAAAYMKAILKTGALAARSAIPPVIRPMLAGLALGFIALGITGRFGHRQRGVALCHH